MPDAMIRIMLIAGLFAVAIATGAFGLLLLAVFGGALLAVFALAGPIGPTDDDDGWPPQ